MLDKNEVWLLGKKKSHYKLSLNFHVLLKCFGLNAFEGGIICKDSVHLKELLKQQDLMNHGAVASNYSIYNVRKIFQ